jgi:hypothetical protein
MILPNDLEHQFAVDPPRADKKVNATVQAEKTFEYGVRGTIVAAPIII